MLEVMSLNALFFELIKCSNLSETWQLFKCYIKLMHLLFSFLIENYFVKSYSVFHSILNFSFEPQVVIINKQEHGLIPPEFISSLSRQ